jgi:Fe-S cluster biogenesis protein NfuA
MWYSILIKGKREVNKMLNKVKDFFEAEYNGACIACEFKRYTPKEIVNNAIQRCLGVALFVQTASDVSFEEIDSLFTEYRRKLEELENV